MIFIFLWETFSYRKLPFGLKNAGATFQRAMSYAFHDIKHVMELYLDDLPSHSQQREDQSRHLRHIFLRYRHYHTWLNPHKCVFLCWDWTPSWFRCFQRWNLDRCLENCCYCVLTSPTDITKLQSLQGKEKFLRRFICNFAEKTHGYMRLLKKNTPFLWDDQTQRDFDNLKHAITH